VEGGRRSRRVPMASPPTLPPSFPADSDDGRWIEFAIILSAAFAAAFTVIVCLSGNILMLDEAQLSCKPGCALRVMPRLVVKLKRVFDDRHADADEPGPRRRVTRRVARKVVTVLHLFRTLSGARCCRSSVLVELPATVKQLLDEVAEALQGRARRARAMVATHEDARPEPGSSLEDPTWHAIRVVELRSRAAAANDAWETFVEMRDAAIAEMEAHLHSAADRRLIRVSALASDTLMAALRVRRLGAAVNRQVMLKLAPATRALLNIGQLDSAVPAVWARLHARFLETGGSQAGAGRGNEVSRVLDRLINSLVPREALSPLQSLWLRLLLFYIAWLALVGGGGVAVATLVERSNRLQQLYVIRDADAYFILMTTVMVVMVLVQLLATRRFLHYQAKVLTRVMLATIEDALLTVLRDAEVLQLIRSVVDTTVTAVIAELVGNLTTLAWPLESGYQIWGGTNKVMALIAAKDEAVFRPAIRDAFERIRRPDMATPAEGPEMATPAEGLAVGSDEVPSGSEQMSLTNAELTSIHVAAPVAVQHAVGFIPTEGQAASWAENTFNEALAQLNETVQAVIAAPPRIFQRNRAAKAIQSRFREHTARRNTPTRSGGGQASEARLGC
jgi:hypothetical protein